MSGLMPALRRVRIYLEPRDAWVGLYVAPGALYFCPLPFVVIRVERVRELTP